MLGDLTPALTYGPYIREVSNGGWFVMDAALTFTFGFWLWCVVVNQPGFRWQNLFKLRLYPFEAQFVTAMFVVHLGSAMRAGYIWTLLEAQNDKRATVPFLVEWANIMILAGVISMIGGMCLMRIFGWKRLWWVAGALAILLPVIARAWI